MMAFAAWALNLAAVDGRGCQGRAVCCRCRFIGGLGLGEMGVGQRIGHFGVQIYFHGCVREILLRFWDEEFFGVKRGGE